MTRAGQKGSVFPYLQPREPGWGSGCMVSIHLRPAPPPSAPENATGVCTCRSRTPAFRSTCRWEQGTRVHCAFPGVPRLGGISRRPQGAQLREGVRTSTLHREASWARGLGPGLDGELDPTLVILLLHPWLGESPPARLCLLSRQLPRTRGVSTQLAGGSWQNPSPTRSHGTPEAMLASPRSVGFSSAWKMHKSYHVLLQAGGPHELVALTQLPGVLPTRPL